jgi:hypothetical protein
MMSIYSIESDRIAPVFFAVVPDSFMHRNPGVAPRPQSAADDWSDEIETALVAPHDRWSF